MELRHPQGDRVREICETIRRHNGTAYLVGGCTRDLLLGIEPNDFDIEIFGITPQKLEEIFPNQLEYVGKSYGIYKLRDESIDLSIPRRERAIGTHHRDFEIEIDPELSIKEAARRRDFTINAIYWEPLRDHFEDPYNGKKDLDEKILRYVSNQFSEDALRVLRGMQFIARFNLTPTLKTLELCRALTPEKISSERIYFEFKKLILLGKEIGKGMEFLKESGWLQYFPELDALTRCQQDPVYHPEGSVWNHIKFAMDAFARMRPKNEMDALVVGLAVMCHDLGKPECTCWNAYGRLSSKRHEAAGVAPTRTFLERLRVPHSIIEQVVPLVELHMWPRKFSNKAYANDLAIQKLAAKVGRIDRLVLVGKCDLAGRPPLHPEFTVENWLLKRARELGLDSSKPEAIIRGRDLVQELHLVPSPQFAEILATAYEAQLSGKFTDLAGGIEFVKEWLHALPNS